jgi:hypothetical protein
MEGVARGSETTASFSGKFPDLGVVEISAILRYVPVSI